MANSGLQMSHFYSDSFTVLLLLQLGFICYYN